MLIFIATIFYFVQICLKQKPFKLENIKTMQIQDKDDERVAFKFGQTISQTENEFSFQGVRQPSWNLFAAMQLAFGTFCFQIINGPCTLAKDDDCLKHFILPNQTTWIAHILVSAVSLFGVFILTITGRASKLFYLAEIVIIYLLVFYPPHTLNHHQLQGLFQLALILLLFFFAVFYLLIFTCIIILKRYRYRAIPTLAMGLIISYFYVNHKVYTSCDNWAYGLNDVQIDQSGGYCKVNEPEICMIDLLDGLQDTTTLWDCTKDPKTIDPQWIQTIDKYSKIPIGTKYIELPRTEYVKLSINIKFSKQQRSLRFKPFQEVFFQQLRFANDSSSMHPETEVYLNISKMEYMFKVKRNETLIKERSELFTQLQSKIKGRTLPKNIIVVFVDTLSRARFLKQLPKSSNWFADCHNQRNQTHTFFQALRFTSIAPYTRPNVFAFEFGIIFDKWNGTASWSTTTGYIDTQVDSTGRPILKKRKNKPVSVHEELRKAGYIVSKVRSQCATSTVELEPIYNKRLEVPTVDHEFASIMCDPNFLPPNDTFGVFAGPFGIFRKCLYGKELNSYMLDYAKDFLNTYKDQPKYLEVQFEEAHEGSTELIKYQDQPIFDFLEWLDQDGFVEDSIVMMMSDHGFHLQGLYYPFEQTLIEKYLPGLFMIADNRVFTTNQINDLLQNQQKTLTFFELYYLQKLIITPDDDPKQKFFEDNSILSGVIPKERGCSELPMVDPNISVCNSKKETN